MTKSLVKPIIQYCLFAVFAALPLTTFSEERNASKNPVVDGSFVDYFSARSYNFQNIDEFFQKKIKEAKKLDFDLHFKWMENRKAFAEFQLHSLVCRPYMEPSDAERLRLFREFSAWRKYCENDRPADAHYVARWNSLKGMMVDTQRLSTRYEAFCLLLESPEEYKNYAKLADKGEIRLDGNPSHPIRMRYGEITTEDKAGNNEINYDFHAELMPKTCFKIKNGYVGCLRTFESPSPSIMAQYYLGVWDDAGKILALYPLDIPVEKRNKLAVESNIYGSLIAIHPADGVYGEKLQLSISGNDAEISLFVIGSEKPVWSGKYPLDSRNQNTIPQK